MTSSSRLAAALLVPIAVLLSGQAMAQPAVPTAQELETARSLYKEGKELRARGDLRGALEKLQAAHALGNTPVTGIELARTYVLVAQLVEAREVCLYIARMPVASDETEKSVEARTDAAKLADELRPRIPTVQVHVAGLETGDVPHLTIDGTSIPDAALSEPQKVDPGRHEIGVHVGEGPGMRQGRGAAEVVEGQSIEVTIVVPAAPPAVVETPPPALPVHSHATSDALIRAGFATAVVGGALGVIAGVTALDKKNQLSTECNAAHQCDSSRGGSADLSTAHTWAGVSTIAFVIGGAGVVTGVVGLFVSKSNPAPKNLDGDQAAISPWLGLGTLGVHGHF